MKITLQDIYRSLPIFTIEDLPDFVVLTGLNGAGKTQILEGIRMNTARLTDERNRDIDPKIYISTGALIPVDSLRLTKAEMNEQKSQAFIGYTHDIARTGGNLAALPETDLQNRRTKELYSIIAAHANKTVKDLTEEDFFRHYPLNFTMTDVDLFYQNFSVWFRNYQDRFNDNAYNLFLNQTYGQENPVINDADFLHLYGDAPWKTVNQILEAAKLDYIANTPVGLHPDTAFELKLVSKITGAEVKFSELSSGEKVLISFAFASYNSENAVPFPRVLLLDEPDASLHPLMSKQLIDVIIKVLVEGKRVKVIMTTHSPSTVAFAPEESLFVVNKTGVKIEKASRDKALKTLTYGVPSFSINYENRRQVFVESPNDVAFYEFLYNKFGDKLDPEISLTFISSGEAHSDKNGIPVANCEQVNLITTHMRESGNKFVWGIIDYDEGKMKRINEFVKVLGGGNRYAIESYLLDPLLVAALLLRFKLIDREHISLSREETVDSLKSFENNRLQTAANFVINALSVHVKDIYNAETTCLLSNGKEIIIPNWYLLLRGHTLEEKLLLTFPKLGTIKKDKEDALKMAVLNMVVDDLPGLISVDLIEILQRVQA